MTTPSLLFRNIRVGRLSYGAYRRTDPHIFIVGTPARERSRPVKFILSTVPQTLASPGSKKVDVGEQGGFETGPPCLLSQRTIR